MRKIIRTIRELTALGRILFEKTEELTDDEAGTVEERHTTTHAICDGCGRSSKRYRTRANVPAAPVQSACPVRCLVQLALANSV